MSIYRVVKAKSRLVAHDVKQHDELDFRCTFAFTVPGSGIRLISQNACECDFDSSHYDVDKAFIRANPEEGVS